MGQGNCSLCQAGKSVIGFGSTSCDFCGNGTFMVTDGWNDGFWMG